MAAPSHRRPAAPGRAIAVAALLVVLLNAVVPVGIRAAFDEGYRGRVSCQLAQLDPLTVDDLLDTAAQAGGRTVWWIGDSIVYSRPDPRVSSPGLLEHELQARYGSDIHVFNAALPAARTADKYAILLRILETHPALIIFQVKYLEFSRAQVESLPLRYPYLNPVIATDPDYAAHYLAFNATSQQLLVPPVSTSSLLADRTVERAFSVYRFRGLLQRLLFGGDLFARLSGNPADPPVAPTDGPMCRGFNPIAREPASFTGAYLSGPFDAFPNPSLYFGDRAATILEGSGVPTFTYIAALNHSLLGALAAGPAFEHNLALVSHIFSDRSFPFRDYDDLFSGETAFLDTEHLTEPGHRAMVEQLLADFGPMFDHALVRR